MDAVAEPILANAWTRDHHRGRPAPVAFEGPFDTLVPQPWPGRSNPADHPLRTTDRREMLERVVELDVVPRLRLAANHALLHANLATPARAPGSARVNFPGGAVAEFAALVLAGDFPRALAYARRVLASGIGISSLYVDLLGPAARHLGHLWDEDRADFAQVTIGLARLQQLLHALSPEFYSEPGHAGAPAAVSHAEAAPDRQALLLTTPGEQPDFGLAIAAEFLRRASWSVRLATPPAGADLRPLVRQTWFAVVGFSLGCAARLDELKTSISQIRAASRNRRVAIMVGGPAFILHPEYVVAVGADMFAADGQQAVALARSVLAPYAPTA